MSLGVKVINLENQGGVVEFSPFEPSLLAVATASNYFVVGKGAQCIYDISSPTPRLLASFTTPEPVFSCSWSQSSASVIAIGDGQGHVTIWDYKSNAVLQTYKEHRGEVFAVQYGIADSQSLLSSSWDQTTKLWTVQRAASVRTFAEHSGHVYCQAWHPRYGDMFATGAADGLVKIWDTSDARSACSIAAVPRGEVMAVDWSKYNEHELYTAGSDKVIKVWDVRNYRAPVKVLAGHDGNVRWLKASPHKDGELVSASFDMSVALWDTASTAARVGSGPLLAAFDGHTEVVYGVDVSNFEDGLIASSSWDKTVRIYNKAAMTWGGRASSCEVPSSL